MARISTSCLTDPVAATQESDVLESFEYSPLVVEASILRDEKSVGESTNQLKKKLMSKRAKKAQDEKALNLFLKKREEFLSELCSVNEVDSFVRFINNKAEEVRKSHEEVYRFLSEIGAIEDLQKELSRELRLQFKGRDFLIDSMRRSIISGNEEFKNSLVEYVKDFNGILRMLVSNAADPETVYSVLVADVQFLASEKRLLRTAHSLAIPLDLSPLRLSLAVLDEQQHFEQSRRYYPPLLLLFNRQASAMDLARPYRTVDGHPVFIRAPRFEVDKTRAQREASDARKNFEQKVAPLMYTIKGLASTRETAPTLIADPLIRVVRAYLSFNPLSKEFLRVIDLGCGTGSLLRNVMSRLLDSCPLDEMINVYALLNDDSRAQPGRQFRNLSLQERYAGLLDSRTWKGDMRKLITELHSLKQKFDISFINRVLDMYGGYGVFKFKLSPRRTNGSCSSFNETMLADEPNVGDVLVFSESNCHEGAWYAISYIFERQVRETTTEFHLLPSVDMKMRKNFFTINGTDILSYLLEISKLAVISIFPGDFKALFPEIKPAKDKIFHCEKTSPASYSVVCISKSKELIDYIKAQCTDFE